MIWNNVISELFTIGYEGKSQDALLPTPRHIRYRRKIDHDQEAFREGYLKYQAMQDEAMRALVTRVQQERCCLMCYETDPHICHRWFVAERAVEMSDGAPTVVHLAFLDA